MNEDNRQNFDELEEILQEFKAPAPEEQVSPLEENVQQHRDKQPKKHKNNRKLLYYGFLITFAAIFVFSSVYLAQYLIRQHQDEQSYDELGDIVAGIQGSYTDPGATQDPFTTLPPFVGSTEPPATDPTEPVILPEYLPIYEMNSDTVGWIKIEDTNINYPVMQTPDSRDYYLNHNFYKQESGVGAIYVREACDVWRPSDNVVIYGHRIINDQMFSPLRNYTSKSFWQSHQYVTFDTLYEHHTYQIFAVFKTSANPGQGYSYHRFNDAVDQADFDQFISKVKELSFYDTGITPQYGDKLITLSTCEYTLDNGRLVVVAVQVS